MSRIQVGLLGFGLAGSVFHAPLIQACAALELRAVGCRNCEGKAVPAGVRCVAIEQVIEDPRIELIVVATPNDSHFELARRALEAGKHVVVDKPFVLRGDEADRLIDLAQARGRLLSVFQNRRWDGDFLTARKVLADGLLGELSYVELHFDRYRPMPKPRWRELPGPGAGALFDLGPHLIDQAYCLLGMPRAVTADVQAQRAGALVDDYFHIVLEYGSARAVLHASSLRSDHGPRITLCGERAGFRHFGLDAQEADLKAGRRPGDEGWGSTPAARAELLAHDGGVTAIAALPGRYQAYYEAIAHSIHSGAPPPISPADARNAFAILEAAVRSGAERRTIVLG